MDWWGPGRAVFFDPRGGTHFDGRWKWPERVSRASAGGIASADAGAGAGSGKRLAEAPTDHRVESLMETNRLRGVSPDGWTASACWEREGDIPDEVSFEAWEAMCEGET